MAPSAGLAQENGQKTIREIRIEGLQRESEGDILARLRLLRIGDVYDPRRVTAESGHLFGTGKFRSVEPSVTEVDDHVIVTYRVVERALIDSVELRGRKSLSANHLRTSPPALYTKAKSLLNEAYLAQDREGLVAKYHEAGYIFAQVKTDQENLDDGGLRVVFLIDEGPRVRIRDVQFVGNENVGDSTLRSLLGTREKDFWFFGLIRPGFYDYQVLEQDLVRIESYYERLGYFDAIAELDETLLDARKENMTVRIRVSEGTQYVFRGYEFAGNRLFDAQTLEDLTAAVPGQPFNADLMRRDSSEISNYYGDRAYIDVKVEPRPQYDDRGDDVRVVVDIEEGNEVFIEELQIRGNAKTDEEVIRREIEAFPGDRVDRSRLEKSRSNLNRLQLFRDVRYRFEDGSAPGNKNLVWSLEEETSGRLIIGFGLTSGFGVIGNFSVTKRNFDITDLPDSIYDIPDSFTGKAQTLTIAAQPGTRRSLYRFSFTEPYLFGTRNALTLSASKLTIFRRDYDEERATFAPRIAHAFDFDRDLVFSLGHRLEEVEISRLDEDAPPDAVAAKGFTTVIAANVGLSYDKVLYEYLEGPYDGTANAINYEYAGGILGGGLDFHKIELSNEFYYPVYEYQRGPETLHHVVSFVNRFGVIEPQHSDDTIPIFERFFLGGPNTVRGFRFRGLGPHQGRDPVGGSAMLYGNLEYSFPLVSKLIRGVIFADYGNLEPDLTDLDFGRMRYAVGGGLRINFPFLGQPLPIGLYVGTALRKEEEDRRRAFLFTIGAPF